MIHTTTAAIRTGHELHVSAVPRWSPPIRSASGRSDRARTRAEGVATQAVEAHRGTARPTTLERREPPSPRPGRPAAQVRASGAVVALQGLLALGFTVLLVVRASSASLPVSFVLGEAGYFLVVGLALLAVGVGLVTGRRWARTPAIVTQLLLLPVVYSLIGPSRQLVLGIVAGVVVAGTFLLLISERSREWSMGLDLPDASR